MSINIMKTHPLLSVVQSSLISLQSPANINVMWNFGYLLGLCLGVQIMSGLFLAMHYASDASLAFKSVIHIWYDVNYGWLLRSIHANGASMFFICMYTHTAWGLYFGSYRFMHTWNVGVIIMLITMATAQLGLMMTSLGMGLYTLSFFHLLTHALFKASLFLCAGSMIHLFSGSQDLRAIKGVMNYMPITSSCLMICSLSLGGTPVLAAFYSKDKIIEEAMSHGFNGACLMLLMMSIVMTMVYSFRLIYYISIESLSMNYELNYDSQLMCKSMLLLTLGGIMGGSALSWILFDGIYDNLWVEYKSLILFFVVCGFVLGILMKFNSMSFWSSFMSMMWFFSSFSTKLMIYMGGNYAKILFKSWDDGWNKCFGPQGLKMEILSLANILSPMNQGLYKMMLMVLMTLIMLIFILFY